MSRKRSLSALLNESSKKESEKITCNCDECNGSVVDSRTKFSHRYRKSKKNQEFTKQDFTFRPRKRNIRQNQTISLGDNQRNSILDHTSFDNDIKYDNEFDESFNNLNNLFKDYSAPDLSDFEFPLNSNKFADSRFT